MNTTDREMLAEMEGRAIYREPQIRPPMKTPEVRYLPVIDFPGYRVGDDGSVWSCWEAHGRGRGRAVYYSLSNPPHWRCLAPDVRESDGRKRYTLRVDVGHYRKLQASHLVLTHFVGPQPNGMEACHNDGDCRNNRLENLRWDTIINNKADMVRHRTSFHGERSASAKLTWEKVRAIRKLYYSGSGLTKTEIGKQHGVTGALIGMIVRDQIWQEQYE